MSPKDKLAEALDKANLPDLAAKARAGTYHIYQSPVERPRLQLSRDLVRANTQAAALLLQRHRQGEFDADPREAPRNTLVAKPHGVGDTEERLDLSGKSFRVGGGQR